jgi:hypothetical protein
VTPILSKSQTYVSNVTHIAIETGPNELRTIIREDLGLYNSVLVGGIYEFEDTEDDLTKPQLFIEPLKYCIDKHAALTVTVRDSHTEKAFYERTPTIDLSNHIQIVQDNSIGDKELVLDEMTKIEQHFLSILRVPWASSASSPWKVVILPLSPSESSGRNRYLITFVFSHALGDGISGLAFHHTLLEAFRKSTDVGKSMILITQDRELSPPFDTPERLPISWSYLLAPLLGVLLPKWLGKLLGLKASVASNNAGTWTGSPILVNTKDPAATCFKLLEIDNADVTKALNLARKHGAKLTAVIHQLIIRALDNAVTDPNVTNWLSHTAVNMRPAVGTSDNEMGLFVTGCFQSHPRVGGSSHLSEQDWAAARSMTEKLAESATVTKNQPIGLLRYAPSIRKWILGKIGQERDGSYDVSNLGAFSDVQGDSMSEGVRCRLTKMIFSHSTDPMAEPLVISAVSVKGGSLVFSVSWTLGALGLPKSFENEFVEGICASLRENFKRLEY